MIITLMNAGSTVHCDISKIREYNFQALTVVRGAAQMNQKYNEVSEENLVTRGKNTKGFTTCDLQYIFIDLRIMISK